MTEISDLQAAVLARIDAIAAIGVIGLALIVCMLAIITVRSFW